MARHTQVKEWNVSDPVPPAFHSRHAQSQSAPLNRWSTSRAKRCLDLILVIAALPLVLPVCLVIFIAIRLDSRGPAFFVQKRIGRHGRPFPIVKFRTMVDPGPGESVSITTIDDHRITSAGRILRYWKLDELPQLLNVLRGEMSLVGPRPRVPDQPLGMTACRPGITGAASLAFAREEILLAEIPRQQRNGYYATRVLPLKQCLDEAYMARATFVSDVKLILRTVLRVWIVNDDLRPAATTAAGEAHLDPHIRGEIWD